MRGRRMGRPGLVGTMARTAVIAGTAQAVTGNVAHRQASRRAQEAAAAPAPPPPPPAAAEAPAAGFDDVLAQLEKLGALRDAGVLDEAEFTAAKARLLMG